MNYLTINGSMYPYENGQYSDTDTRITGKHFVMVMTADVSAALMKKITDQGVMDIRTIAEARVLDKHPEYLELTSFGTRKKGYWKLVASETIKVLYWVMNKQPASITFIVNKIDGLGSKSDEPTNMSSVYGKIQLNMQNGVTTQLVIPETGYSCIIPAVCNKKTMPIFTKHFMCEKYIELYEAGQLMDTEIIAHMPDVYKKYDALEDYRHEVQKNIWEHVNFTLREDGYIEAWKKENLYTMDTRVAYAIQAQANDILDKYASDFHIPAAQAMTIQDLRDKETYDEMIRIIANYGAKFGVSVKTSEGQADTMTYMPSHWMRKKTPQDIIPESVVLKQVRKAQQALRKAPLNELLQAYIQIDWYMNQPNVEDYLVDGYHVCSHNCDYILGRKDKICPKCGKPNPTFEPDMLSFDEEQYMIGTWDTYKLD